MSRRFTHPSFLLPAHPWYQTPLLDGATSHFTASPSTYQGSMALGCWFRLGLDVPTISLMHGPLILWINPTKQVRVSDGGKIESLMAATSTDQISLSTWAHLVAVFDADALTASLYVDGVLKETNNVSAPTYFDLSFRIGSYDNGFAGLYFAPGHLCDVAMLTWSGANTPTDDDILTWYRTRNLQTLPFLASNGVTLQRYYPLRDVFDPVTGTLVLRDHGVDQAHATANGLSAAAWQPEAPHGP